jgi:CRISPR-associated protein Cas1
MVEIMSDREFILPRLMAAWQQVRQRTNAAGIDGITTDLFAGVAEEELRRLQQQLQHDRYCALPAKGFYRRKSSGGVRLIGISTVRDRVVQRLALQRLYPILDETFSPRSYAYRPGLGVADAIAQLQEFYCTRPVWTIKADIVQFFDRLCWAILLSQLETLPLDPRWIELIEQQLKSGVVTDGRLLFRNRGVVQGNSLSGALANLYLSEFDRRCEAAGIELVRYGDDFVAIAPGWLEATRILQHLETWLGEIYLSLQPSKTRIVAPHEEFKFLGYRFRGGETIPPERQSPRSPSRRQSGGTPPPSRPPRACGLAKSRQRGQSAQFLDAWREPMTTLYVTEQQAYIKVKQQQFQVFCNWELQLSVPVNRVSHMVLFGCCNLSHGAVNLALRRRIPILFLSHRGRYFGRLHSDGIAQVGYLTQQVQRSLDPAFVLHQAKAIVAAKLHNARVMLRRWHYRRNTPVEAVTGAIDRLRESRDRIEACESIEALFGHEGQATRVYFEAFGALLHEPFEFRQRTRRPPTDPVNSLLSLGYTLLHQNIHSLIQAAGLHPHFGNLHVPRNNHPALVSDLMEEFRAPVVDSLVAYLVNAKRVGLDDFTPPDRRGGVYLYPETLKTFLKHWQERLQMEVTHPHTGYKVSTYRCFELQVWEYVCCLTGERESYRPMRWN